VATMIKIAARINCYESSLGEWKRKKYQTANRLILSHDLASPRASKQ
jgi:hypothetical protein